MAMTRVLRLIGVFVRVCVCVCGGGGIANAATVMGDQDAHCEAGSNHTHRANQQHGGNVEGLQVTANSIARKWGE